MVGEAIPEGLKGLRDVIGYGARGNVHHVGNFVVRQAGGVAEQRGVHCVEQLGAGVPIGGPEALAPGVEPIIHGGKSGAIPTAINACDDAHA